MWCAASCSRGRIESRACRYSRTSLRDLKGLGRVNVLHLDGVSALGEWVEGLRLSRSGMPFSRDSQIHQASETIVSEKKRALGHLTAVGSTPQEQLYLILGIIALLMLLCGPMNLIGVEPFKESQHMCLARTQGQRPSFPPKLPPDLSIDVSCRGPPALLQPSSLCASRPHLSRSNTP